MVGAEHPPVVEVVAGQRDLIKVEDYPPGHRLRVGWLTGVPREQKMLKGHLPRVIYHQVY